MRTMRLALIFGVAAWLAACGGGEVGDGQGGAGGQFPSGAGGSGADGAGGDGGDGAGVPATEDPFEPAPAVPPLPNEALDALATTIDGILAGFSAQTHSVLIVGAETGQVVYERDKDQRLKPASNMKLLTTATAFATLGEDHRHETIAFATSAPQNGVINGDLLLFGDHDYTWSTRFYPSARWPLDRLAEQLKASGIDSVTGTVQARFEHLYDGYQFASYSTSAHRAATVSAFSAALSAAGISVGGTTTSPNSDLPAGVVEVGRWTSLPLHVGASPINRISHNEFADILIRHVGWENSNTSSYDAGEAQVVSLLQAAGSSTDGLVFNDGSGLSHGNRVSAQNLVDLFVDMAQRREGLAWERSFTVAGVKGTIGGRMTGPDTYGRFKGKTGTLSDTIALSGVLDHRHDGQRYYVSLLMNGVTSQSAARGGHDSIVQALAANLRGGDGLPERPDLISVRNDGNGQTVTVSFTDVGADGYLVWRSPDGRRWDRQEARFVSATTHRTVGFDGEDKLFVRVTAVGPDGESPPSDTYAAMLEGAPSRILVVDGNDRWQAAAGSENPLGEAHDFVVPYADVMGEGFDSCDNDAVVDGQCPLDGYDLVVWALGEEGSADLTFDTDEQALVGAFSAAGGRLFVAGAELGFDLAQGSASDQAFLEDVLHASFVDDDAGTYHVLVDGEPVSFLTPDRMNVNFPDRLAPAGGAEPFVQYLGGTGDTAGVVMAGEVVTLGFPFASVAALEHRQAIWTAALEALNFQ